MNLKFNKQARQGDMLLTKLDKLPDNLIEERAVNGDYVLAHSETGHNHVVKASHEVKFFRNPDNEFVGYLSVQAPTEVRHLRSFDTHKTIGLKEGVYEVRRQREYTPEGLRRAQD